MKLIKKVNNTGYVEEIWLIADDQLPQFSVPPYSICTDQECTDWVAAHPTDAEQPTG